MASRKSRRDRQEEPEPARVEEQSAAGPLPADAAFRQWLEGPPDPQMSARDRTLWHCFRSVYLGFERFNAAHPEWVGDERYEEGKQCSGWGVAEIVAALDGVAILEYADVQARERELEACKAELVTLRARAVELQAEIAALETDTPHLDALWAMGPTAGPLLLRLAAVLRKEAEERKDAGRVQDLEKWIEAHDG